MSTTFRDERSDGIKRESLSSRFASPFNSVMNIDWILLLVAIALTLIGFVMIGSATSAVQISKGYDPYFYVKRQMLSAALGMASATVVAMVNYRIHRTYAVYYYIVTTILLGLIFTPLGVEHRGTLGWIELFGFEFQPSELVKVSIILMLAAHFHEYREEALGGKALIEALSIVAVPLVLIVLQPDIGTFLVVVMIVAGILLVARVRWRFMGILTAISLVGMYLVFKLQIVKDYQLVRLTAFLDPENAPAKYTYNVKQAQTAIGAGGLTGTGLGQGQFTNSGFVPVNHSDFIFSAIGEQTGLVGVTIIFALYALLFWRAIVIAKISKDTYGSLIAAGITVMFLVHFAIPIGMAVGVMPVTGLPLSFMAYGGTHEIIAWVFIGLLQSVHIHRN